MLFTEQSTPLYKVRRPAYHIYTKTNGSANSQQIWWQKLCCCWTSSAELFAH